jgi:hypothetical protein
MAHHSCFSYFSFSFFVFEFLGRALFLVVYRCLVFVLRVGWMTIFTVSGLLGFFQYFCLQFFLRPDFYPCLLSIFRILLSG